MKFYVKTKETASTIDLKGNSFEFDEYNRTIGAVTEAFLQNAGLKRKVEITNIREQGRDYSVEFTAMLNNIYLTTRQLDDIEESVAKSLKRFGFGKVTNTHITAKDGNFKIVMFVDYSGDGISKVQKN